MKASGIFLDAGSTSTKAYIYEWEHKTTTNLPLISLSLASDNVPRTLKIRPGSYPFFFFSSFLILVLLNFLRESLGIATIEPNVTRVATYLEPIIEWAQSIIPKNKLSTTGIYFQVNI